MIIEKKYHFYAAHRNKQAGEKCGRIHGHTYKIKVQIEFLDDRGESGIGMLFSEIDSIIEPIIKSFDHYLILDIKDPLVKILFNLNEPIKVMDFPTSAENLAEFFFNTIKRKGLNIVNISLAETESSTVIFKG